MALEGERNMYIDVYSQLKHLIPAGDPLNKKVDPQPYWDLLCSEDIQETQDASFAWLMLHYWGYIAVIHKNLFNRVPFSECYDTLLDCILYVKKHPEWRNPDAPLYEDPNGGDKIFHRREKCALINLISKYDSNKHKANVHNISLDALHEQFNDSADGIFGDLFSDSENWALNIIVEDSFRHSYEKGILMHFCGCHNYSLNDIIKSIESLSIEDFISFNTHYITCDDASTFLAALNNLKSKELKELKVYIKKSLYEIGKDYYGW